MYRDYFLWAMLAVIFILAVLFVTKMQKEVLDGCCDCDLMNLDGNLY